MHLCQNHYLLCCWVKIMLSRVTTIHEWQPYFLRNRLELSDTKYLSRFCIFHYPSKNVSIMNNNYQHSVKSTASLWLIGEWFQFSTDKVISIYDIKIDYKSERNLIQKIIFWNSFIAKHNLLHLKDLEIKSRNWGRIHSIE